MSYKDDLDKLIIWAESKGYSVVLSTSEDNSIDSISKLIFISTNQSVKKQVCVLLHECGHAQVFSNNGSISMGSVGKKWGEKSKKRKTSVVIEEVEAWRRGINLAKKLKISLTEDEIKLNMINAISKYIKWAQ